MPLMLMDRWLNFVALPPFLSQTGARDHDFWRVATLPVLWALGGLLAGGVLFFVVMSFAEALAGLFPAAVRGVVAAPLGAVRPAEVGPDLGLIGEARRSLQLAAGPAGFAIAVPLAGWFLMHRRAASWFTSAPRFRWSLLAAGLILFCLSTGLAMLADGWLHGFPKSPPLLRSEEKVSLRLVYFGVTLVAFTAAAAAEEVITRGWLMQQTAVFTHNLAIIAGLNAAAFAFVHLDPDPARNAALFISGLSLSLIALRTGGLEFGIGVHAANNLMLSWFSTPFRVTDNTGRMSLADLAVQVGVTLSGLALAELTLRWKPLRRLAGV